MPACVICAKPNNSFNYGVYSCNACTMFYRRGLIRKRNFLACARKEKCYTDHPYHFECRVCRFEKCLKSGIKTIHSTV